MYHQALQAFINMFLAVTLLSCALSSLTDACSTKTVKQVTNQAQPIYDSKTDTVRVRHRSRDAGIRFRRGVAFDDEEGLTTPPSISNIEVFQDLDLDFDDAVSVIEWSLEGGSVTDFWQLLTKHDSNGDELISRGEFETVLVRIHA